MVILAKFSSFQANFDHFSVLLINISRVILVYTWWNLSLNFHMKCHFSRRVGKFQTETEHTIDCRLQWFKLLWIFGKDRINLKFIMNNLYPQPGKDRKPTADDSQKLLLNYLINVSITNINWIIEIIHWEIRHRVIHIFINNSIFDPLSLRFSKIKATWLAKLSSIKSEILSNFWASNRKCCLFSLHLTLKRSKIK